MCEFVEAVEISSKNVKISYCNVKITVYAFVGPKDKDKQTNQVLLGFYFFWDDFAPEFLIFGRLARGFSNFRTL